MNTNRKRRLAELMADEIVEEAKSRIKPGGALFSTMIGCMLDKTLLMACGRKAEAKLVKEEEEEERGGNDGTTTNA